MNLIAMIGTVEKIQREPKMSIITLKVEKPFFDSSNESDYFDSIDINVNTMLFSQDLSFLDQGTLIGLKGRIKSEDKNLKVIAEKIQVF